MRDPVVDSLFRLAASSGLFNNVLRYNMRGIGRSCGSMSMWGSPDMEDIREVVKYVREGLPQSSERVLLMWETVFGVPAGPASLDHLPE